MKPDKVQSGEVWFDAKGGDSKPGYPGPLGRTLRIECIEHDDVAVCSLTGTTRLTRIKVQRLLREARFTLSRDASGKRVD